MIAKKRIFEIIDNMDWGVMDNDIAAPELKKLIDAESDPTCANCRHYKPGENKNHSGNNCDVIYLNIDFIGQGFDGLRVEKDFYCKFYES